MAKSETSQQSFVEVTQNLATALVYLRHATVPRVLWIDALCVNQEDMEERSSQVARMADIYRRAHRVVVWLGPESLEERSAQAVSTMLDIGSQIEVDWTAGEMRATDQGDPSWANRNVPIRLDSSQLSPILMLLSRPWFERVWVQQEIVFATDYAVLLCGQDSIIRRQFTNAIYCLRSKAREVTWDLEAIFKERLMLLFMMCVSMYSSEHESYASILRSQASMLKCSDARGRSYFL
jgi:hypothetical protein